MSKFGKSTVASDTKVPVSKFGKSTVASELPSKFVNKNVSELVSDDPRKVKPGEFGKQTDEIQGYIDQMVADPESYRAQIARSNNPKLAKLIDLTGGMSSMIRGGLNMLPGDLGDELIDPRYLDKDSGMYLAGSVLDPAAYATGARIASIPALATVKGAPLLEKMWKGSTIGGLTGATVGGLTNDSDRTSGSTMGGIVGSLFGGAFPLIGAVAGRAIDIAKDRMPDIRVANMLKEAAGRKIDTVKQALGTSVGDVTVAQAVGKDAPAELAGIQQYVDNNIGDPALEMARHQEAARQSLLRNNTPDLAAAKADRTAQAEPLYDLAFAKETARRQAHNATEEQARLAQEVLNQWRVLRLQPSKQYEPKPLPIPTVLKKLTDNPIIQAAANRAKILARTGVEINGAPLSDATIELIQKNPMSTLEGLHVMKMAIDDQFKNRAAETGLQNFTDGGLTATKGKLLKGIKEISPEYDAAREAFKRYSAPVDQSKVMTELSNTVERSGGGERVQPYLDAIDTAGNRLLKRADQNPRFGSIEEVLTPAQNAAKNKVKAEFIRDRSLNEAAKVGKNKAEDTIKKNLFIARLPHTMNTKVTRLNDALNFVGNKLNTKTLARLNEVMYNPKLAAQVIDTLPMSEKAIILRAMSDPAVIGRGVGMMTGAQQQ